MMHSAIFEGVVWHNRLRPTGHRFRYRIFMMYLDLDELDRVFRGRWFWSARRPALARFRRRDHFGNETKPLIDCVRDKVEQETGARPEGSIRLLTNLSYLGYCFNPVSFYYCFDKEDQSLECIIAEVTNTPWGERTLYVLPAPEQLQTDKYLEFTPAKEMHVSPFMPMDMDYLWRFSSPGETLTVLMENSRKGKRIFNAGIRLNRREIDGRSLARLLVFRPFMTIKIILGIHWQALRLWLKRVPVFDHPDKHKSIAES